MKSRNLSLPLNVLSDYVCSKRRQNDRIEIFCVFFPRFVHESITKLRSKSVLFRFCSFSFAIISASFHSTIFCFVLFVWDALSSLSNKWRCAEYSQHNWPSKSTYSCANTKISHQNEMNSTERVGASVRKLTQSGNKTKYETIAFVLTRTTTVKWKYKQNLIMTFEFESSQTLSRRHFFLITAK